jgi:hypothetical protein
MVISTATIAASNMKNSGKLRVASKKLIGISAAIQRMRISQPCHVAGDPQPQPYRFAGNQYCFGWSFIFRLPGSLV